MTGHPIRYRVLHIENDRSLVDGFRSCIAQELDRIAPGVSLDISIAETIEDATAAIENENPPFDVLLVDLMLPLNAENHALEAELQMERRGLVRELFKIAEAGPAGRTDQILSLKHRIAVLDSELEILIVDDGGFSILRKLVHKNGDKPLERPVVFWTARGLPTVKEQCASLVEPDYVRILEKPARETVVLKMVVELARKFREAQHGTVRHP